MSFRGDKYLCRPVDQTDLRRLEKHRNSPSTWENLTSSLPVLPNEQQAWLESLGKDSYYFIAIDMRTHTDVGLLRITNIDWQNRNAAVGLDIFLEDRNQGHGSRLMPVLLEYCFEELNLHKLWLLVLDTNHAARKIYVNNGFVAEGKMYDMIFRHGHYHDYIMMGIVEGEYRRRKNKSD